MSGVPLILPFKNGLHLRAKHVKFTNYGAEINYHLPFSNVSSILRPREIECELRFDRPTKTPKQEVVVQGKWECMPAAMAMCSGHTLFNVKRALGRHGWRNDDSGAAWEASRAAMQDLGFDVIWLNRVWMYELKDKISNCVVTVNSLNYEGRCHALSWINGEMLDPNMGRPGRLWYGAEWTPWTIGARAIEVLLKPMKRIEYEDLETTIGRGSVEDVVQAIIHHAA